MTLLATTSRGCPCSATIASAVSRPKNSVSVSHARCSRDRGDVGGRLDAEHRDAEGEELAQQVAVVAGDLDHEGFPVQPELGLHPGGVRPRMRDPGRADRGEVRVVAEDPLRQHELAHLSESARRADPQVEREPRVGRVGVRQQLVRERLQPEVEDGLELSRAAAATDASPVRRELDAPSRRSPSPRALHHGSSMRRAVGRRAPRRGSPVRRGVVPLERQRDGRLPVEHARPAELLRRRAASRASARRSPRSGYRTTRSTAGSGSAPPRRRHSSAANATSVATETDCWSAGPKFSPRGSASPRASAST